MPVKESAGTTPRTSPFATPPEELNDVAKLVRQEMTGALSDRLTVPLKVDVSVGENWLEVKEYR